ncbi:MAG: hypothetical protein HZA88_25455 [Verrucomicrobia bacterium]|nr:hypothetical protein [Verrucomicrobiota bacterium]
MRTVSKTIIVALACAAGFGLAYAQTSPPPPPDGCPPPGGTRRDPVAMLTSALSLTSDQQAEIKVIFDVWRLKMDAVMEDTTLSNEDKMAKMKELRATMDTAIKVVLTADQQKKFDELQKNRPQPPGGRQHGRPPGPPPGE